MVVDLDAPQLKCLERSLIRSFQELETVYKRNVNVNSDYANSVADSCAQVLSVYRAFSFGDQLMTSSSSLSRFLYGKDTVQLELF